MNKPLNSEGVSEFNGLEYISFSFASKPLKTFSQNTASFMTLVIKPCCVWILGTAAEFREARAVDIPDVLTETLAECGWIPNRR
jgi:hypothetical protein